MNTNRPTGGRHNEPRSRLRPWLLAAFWFALIGALLCVVLPVLIGRPELSKHHDTLRSVWAKLGYPAGLEGVLGFRGKPMSMLLVTAAAVLVFYLAMRMSVVSMKRVGSGSGFVWMSALMVALVSSGLLVAVMRSGGPPFAQRPDNSAAFNSALTELTHVRAAIEQYRYDHGGRYPAIETLWESLTAPTDAEGSVHYASKDETPEVRFASERVRMATALAALAGDRTAAHKSARTFGPYLSEPPINPYTQDTTVAIDNSGSWQYNPRNGTMRIVVSPSRMPGFTGRDAMVAPINRQLGSLKPQDTVSRTLAWTWRLTSGEYGLAGWRMIGAGALALWLLWFFAIRRVLGKDMDRGQAKLVIALVAISAVLAFMVTGFMIDDVSRQTCMVFFAAALLWAWGCVAFFPPVQPVSIVKQGRKCPGCDADVSMEVASGKHHCGGCGCELVATHRPSLSLIATD